MTNSKKNEYYNLQQYLELILKQINNCIDNLQNSTNAVEKYYTVDNYSREKQDIKRNNDKLNKMRDDLKNVVIPQVAKRANN